MISLLWKGCEETQEVALRDEGPHRLTLPLQSSSLFSPCYGHTELESEGQVSNAQAQEEAIMLCSLCTGKHFPFYMMVLWEQELKSFALFSFLS